MSRLAIWIWSLTACVASHACYGQSHWIQPSNLGGYYSVERLYAARDGSLWAIAANGNNLHYAIERFHEGQWKVISTSQANYPFSGFARPNDIVESGDTAILVSFDSALLSYSLQSDTWSGFRFADSLDDHIFGYLFKDSHGSVWVTAEGNRILARDTVPGHTSTQWVRSYREIFEFLDGSLILRYRSNEVLFSELSAPCEDDNGEVWWAYSGGFLIFDGTTFRTLLVDSQSVALSGLPVSLLFDTMSNSIVVGSHSFVSQHSPKSAVSIFDPIARAWKNIVWDKFHSSSYPNRITETSVGVLAGGVSFTGDGVLNGINGGDLVPFDFLNFVTGYPSSLNYLSGIQDVLEYQNDIWCAIGNGIIVLAPSAFTGNSVCVSKIKKKSIRLFPNPVGDRLFVEQGSNYSLFDPLGQRYPISFTDEAIDVSQLRAGVYFLSTGEQVVKFIKK